MALKKNISVLPLRLAHFALFRLVFVCVSVVQRRQQQQGFLSSWPFLHHAHYKIAPSHARAIMRKIPKGVILSGGACPLAGWLITRTRNRTMEYGTFPLRSPTFARVSRTSEVASARAVRDTCGNVIKSVGHVFVLEVR